MVKYHILTEYREVAASAVAYPPVSESSGVPLPIPLCQLHPSPSAQFTSVRFRICFQEAGKALVIPLGFRVSMDGSDYLLSCGLSVRLLLESAIE
ncbi:hypothetical protein EVAR_74497_1 [Eumeta japonica]|uniref:Uncharacterized protein n=1 Tax=Eumeta variegata TaxID=151549 RepID=A0A4C1TCE8_EUMVA|nr:hypothetical protein EVAR_74497_1 [Eumeta japonica]